MKVDDALPLDSRVFLDTAPIIYFVERHPTFAAVLDVVFDRLDRVTMSAVTSPVTLLECLVLPYRSGSAALRRDFIDLIVDGPGVTFIPLDDSIAQLGAELRSRYNLSLADAFQVAAALSGGCDAMLTDDVAIRRVSELPIVIVGDLGV